MKIFLTSLLGFALCMTLDSCAEPNAPSPRTDTGSTAETSKAREIAQQVSAIEYSPHNPLPPAQRTSVDPNSQVARMAISNETSYTLTVLYSGPTPQSIVLSPKAARTINLAVGNYRVAATVDAADVRPFAGNDQLQGGKYDNTFYIETVPY
jgi:hypothetical protein